MLSQVALPVVGPPPSQKPPPLDPGQLLDIQGDIWSKGFPKYNETYYFFSIEKPAEFTHCLKELLKGERPLISNLARVKRDHEDIAADKKKAEDKAIAEGKTAKDAVIITRDLANALIAFSSEGLQTIQTAFPDDEFSLDLSAIESTDPGFFNGMKSQDVKNAINDPDKETWDELFRSDNIHGLLKIGGSSETEVDKLLGKIKAALKHDTAVIKDVVGKSLPTDKNSRVDGATRPKKLRGKEHFGFEDGISQPLMGGIDKLEPEPDGKEGFVKNMNTDPKLLIVTGASVTTTGVRPTWMYNGSFLVLRKLEQDVGRFRALTADYETYNCKDAAHMGAKMMGRWQSGAPIALAEFRTQDSTDADKAKLINNFGYTDKIGCPVAAHIRKTNVREIFGPNEKDQPAPRTRIIRNGIPYGTEYTEDKNDKSTRGLLFACYQAYIEDGFQHMQGNWANGMDFRTPDAGLDPIIGQPGSDDNGMIRTKITDQDGGDQKLKPFPPLVTLKGGGYFFVPSIKALGKDLSADPPK